ncbi:MAG: zinc ribbon domain-containing protein [Chlamydiia bacterium]|nr:zinc ribbon domain-containing protein [Chlamydiia bacterium]
MLDTLVPILAIQKLDMEMIQLIRLKQQRQQELKNLYAIEKDLKKQQFVQDSEILDTKTQIRVMEGDIAEVQAKLKKLSSQQDAVKKLDEFNALTQEMSAAERERTQKEARLSELLDKLATQEDAQESLKTTLSSTQESSKQLEEEIVEAIGKINEEGQKLKSERDELVKTADPEVFKIYERLLRNKRDEVVVPIENRACSGCHIQLTAQDENLVRKGERLVFCEHCSRIHYWQESEMLDGTDAKSTRQRRRKSTKV